MTSAHYHSNTLVWHWCSEPIITCHKAKLLKGWVPIINATYREFCTGYPTPQMPSVRHCMEKGFELTGPSSPHLSLSLVPHSCTFISISHASHPFVQVPNHEALSLPFMPNGPFIAHSLTCLYYKPHIARVIHASKSSHAQNCLKSKLGSYHAVKCET